MILGNFSNTDECDVDVDAAIRLLGAIIETAVDDARLARRKPVDDANILLAERWLRLFIEDSQWERSIIRLSGLGGDTTCRRN